MAGKADNDVKFSEVTPGENSTLMANGRQKSPDKQTFATFIYNRRDGTFLGRNGKSWLQILVFYVIFYSLLAAFWIACLYIFLQTIDDDLPRYYGENTIIGANPGVGYHPWLDADPESTLIQFDPRDPASYKKYVDAMNVYLAKYQNTNGTRVCHGSDSNSQLMKNGSAKVENKEQAQACRFELGVFEDNECGPKNDFGFKDGKPCVILSLNRLIGWKPVDYDSDVPKEVRARYKPGSIAFNCDGGSDSDKELLGRVIYVPGQGIDGRFYPFAVMNNYHQPIAMVKFTSLPPNRVVIIECRAYAKNIEHDVENRIGMVSFELQLQNKAGPGSTAEPSPAAPTTSGAGR